MTQHKYQATDRMSDLVGEDYSLLMVLSRFNISLGFGDQSVAEVCARHGVDTCTFLSVVNFLCENDYSLENGGEGTDLPSLISYLKNAHRYFLGFKLPLIRVKLVEAIASSPKEVSFLILRFFDDYVLEVKRHMEYEDRTVFTYVEQLLDGTLLPDYNIGVFSKRHSPIGAKLSELKNIIIKYYPAGESSNLLNEVLFDIFSCERDLMEHCRVEDYLFVPLIAQVEKERGVWAGKC